MKLILNQIGIHQFDDFIYEYPPIQLNWWDDEHKTSIEVEVHEKHDAGFSVDVIFSLDVEGIVERTIVFHTTIQNGIYHTLIAKPLLEYLNVDIVLDFSEEQNAFLTHNSSNTNTLLKHTLKLIEGKQAAMIDLNEDIQSGNFESEIGLTLDHFLAMFSFNNLKINLENIKNQIALSIQIEGPAYFEDLKNDAKNDIGFDYEEMHEITPKDLQLIKDTILSYR